MPTTITPAHKEQFLAADGPILTNTPPLAARGQPWRARGAVESLKSRNQEMPSYGYGPGGVNAARTRRHPIPCRRNFILTLE
jgi:hypothetical protein